MGLIIFNDICSLDYGIQVETPPDYEFPEREYTLQPIPGRNGDLVQDKGSYKNVTRPYKIAIGSIDEEFSVMANRISNWLHSGSGYLYLEDSYEPEYYRLAMYSENLSITNILSKAGRATINFNCKPQRFLKYGDEVRKFTNPGKLINPTGFVALPIITVKGSGSGTLQIGNYVVSISNIINGMILNSDIQDAYYLANNLNMNISLSNDFPKLEAGSINVSWTGGITSVEIIPKWWTL